MLDVEVIGAERVPAAPPAAEVERLVSLALASAGIDGGHVAIEFVTPDHIAELNWLFRKKNGPTDVLSFPVDLPPTDGSDPSRADPPGTRELGDVLICPEHTADLREAIVHGALHLTGMDHERDDGEMLALQRELLAWNEAVAGS